MSRSRYPDYSVKVRQSAQWKRLRWEILKRDGFRCKICGAVGRLEIDHIKPVRNHPELSFGAENLQALCVPCHSRKTQSETGDRNSCSPERKQWLTLLRNGI
ncbi:HNH endonuclease [Paracoccus endophyticus]|uniref:HNH endonuclease n=1 Tax=Paracoccus endophyticus TaxID=2233774 RepID=UPI000DD9A8C6|nr:HNH endonuclease signature motif containing protein [Paracoccus endophyticus]